MALEQTVRTHVPLIQVPPRGLWGRSGPVAHTSIEAWLGERPAGAPMTLDEMVLRYLRAFGPASVMDAQAWCGLTRLQEVFERLRPDLVTFRDEGGRELFDVPDAPRPTPRRPPHRSFLYDFENLHLSYADRTRTLPPEVVGRIVVNLNESVSTFTLDGFVAGTWKVVRERRSGDARDHPAPAADRRRKRVPWPRKGSGSSRSWRPTRRPGTSGSSIGERRTPSCNPEMSCPVRASRATIRQR